MADKRDDKLMLGLLVGGGAAAGLAYLLTRKPAEPDHPLTPPPYSNGPIVDPPIGPVETFSNPLAYWRTNVMCWAAGGYEMIPPMSCYALGDPYDRTQCIAEAVAKEQDGQWTPIQIGPLSTGQDAWGCLCQAIFDTFTYQGPGGTYFCGVNLCAEGDPNNYWYSRYANPVPIPSASTPREFKHYMPMAAARKYWRFGGQMQAVQGKQVGYADLVVYMYKGLKPPDGLTAWIPGQDADKIVGGPFIWPRTFFFP